MTRNQLITNFMRLMALLQTLTVAITFAPANAIAAWHAWLGLGEMPHNAVLLYAVRGGAFVQGAIGVLLWVIASDVVRYRPLVITVGAIYLASGPAFYVIDAMAGLPQFWCAFDCASCSIVGSVILALCWWPESRGASRVASNLKS